MTLPNWPYVYFWNRMDRKGQPCKVTARFPDGFTAITSRNAIRKAPPVCSDDPVRLHGEGR